MRIRKFAAIDIGSNAIRLLVQNVIEQGQSQTQFRKNSLIRIPVRLGEDSFIRGTISAYNSGRVLQTIRAFKHLMEVMEVEKYLACATSAMREADNGNTILRMIYEETGINIQLIDGKKEASIIASTDLRQLIQEDQSYLFIDVGGGSTEFSLITEGAIRDSQSFRVGTVRLLKGLVRNETWQEIEYWIREKCGPLSGISIIGSGGNINKLHKMSGRREGEPLSYAWLNAQYHSLERMSYEERILNLGLNPDRADVIVPATRIFLLSAKWSKSRKIHVPKIGLSDGLVKTLYYQGEQAFM